MSAISTKMLTDNSITSESARSPLRYPGGKQKAIKTIRHMLPKKCLEYREPMVGGGSVFLHAKLANIAQKYWINDRFEELIAFWKTAQDPGKCKRLQNDLEILHASFSSPVEIERFFLNAREEQDLCEYRTALLFFFFNRVTFSGTTRAGGFSRAASVSRFTLSSIERLRHLPLSISGTKITNYDFEPVISEPGDDVFLFLDPPYYTASRLYGKNGALHAFDHTRLRDALRNSHHRFLITYDDCAEVRDLYSSWANIISWELQYGMNNCSKEGQSKIGAELFIANYDIPGIL